MTDDNEHPFIGSDGTEHIAVYVSQHALELSPIRYETFLALEDAPQWSQRMTQILVSRKALVGPIKLLTQPWDEQRAIEVWRHSIPSHLFRLAAFRQILQHPEVVRLVRRHDLVQQIRDPMARHEFIARFCPHDMTHVPIHCGYYPDELIEFLEHRKKWGIRRIFLEEPPAPHMICRRLVDGQPEYLPLQQESGRWFFAFSGLQPAHDGLIAQNLVIASNDEMKDVVKSGYLMSGQSAKTEWRLRRVAADPQQFELL